MLSASIKNIRLLPFYSLAISLFCLLSYRYFFLAPVPILMASWETFLSSHDLVLLFHSWLPNFHIRTKMFNHSEYTPSRKNLLWKIFARDKEGAYENRRIKRPRQLRFEHSTNSFYFSPSECPGLCWLRPWHSLGEKKDELVERSNRSWLGLFMRRFS